MACNCILIPSFLPSLPLNHHRNFQKPKIVIPISCNLAKDHHGRKEDQEESRIKRMPSDIVKFSATLTVISASLPQPSAAAAGVSRKKRFGKKGEVLTPEELKKWAEGLPVVTNRLAYSEILDLSRENKLKHVIKPPNAGLKQRSEVVLAVLEDNRVVRIVLPSVENDPMFWEEWDELQISGLCMNAYSPPLRKPEMPVPRPYLGFLWKILMWMLSLVKLKPQSKKALELKRVREEFKQRKNEELAKMRECRVMMEKAIKTQQRLKRREMKKMKREESLRQAQERSQVMELLWERLANSSNVSTALGFVFFYIFYHMVVVNYRKQKRDYEDRLKMEKAEAEEKKMREPEKEMEGIEDGDGEGGDKGENNPHVRMVKQFMKSGARVRRAPSKRPTQYLERGANVKFSDVAGLGKIRIELEEIVKFFHHAETYRKRGVKIPGGILLCGPPGVGKTLLAKALAGEAGVNFFSISATEFIEMLAGLGASRVRALYQEANENAPSIIFIDELDSVGSERGLLMGSGAEECDSTLTQLLVCLDGFEGKGEVITIASTNRPDVLDPALLRPGRFDRKIYIPKPGLIGRIEILKVHARNKPMAPDVDYMDVASMTDGMVGAELANIIEVAAIHMMRDGRTQITTDDLLQAAQMEERGALDRKERSPEMWKQVAINEAAMAVVAVNFSDFKDIEFVTIAPRAGREFGYVRMKMDNMRFKAGLLSRQSLLDYITVQLAPRAADELWYGIDQLSTIGAGTADNARSAARALVLGGLSEKHYGLNNFWIQDRIYEIDSEASQILDVCYERTKEILEQNQELMDAIVDALLEKKSLTKREFFNLVELHGSLRPMPPCILNIRSAKRSMLQNGIIK